MNLAMSLHATAERRPEADAIVDGDLRLTYARLRERVAAVAGGLSGLGIGRGDSVATVLKNRHQNVEVFWACQWLGARFVPLSWRNLPEDVHYCIDDAGAGVVIVEAASAEHGERAENGGATVVPVEGSGAGTYAALLGSDPVAPALDLDPGATSIMLYTSGTTGRPKGVPRSHRAERTAAMAQALQHGYVPGERTLGIMPLYHTMGDHSMIAMSLLDGCYVCLPDWSVDGSLGLVAQERVSSLYLAPTLFHDLVTGLRSGGADISSVRALGYAGAAMTGALVEACSEAFGPEVFVNHYGSTEIYTYSIGRNQETKPGNAGRASMNAVLRLVALDAEAGPDDLVGPDDDGQIICHMSSDEAFERYWNRPDADAKSIRGGWYFTGDLGSRDEDGDLWIVGRIDDMIISGGENIHPLEVENVLARAPGVREVAVVGGPDDRLGQRVTAYVVGDPGVTAEGLDAFCLDGERIARYKRPRTYHVVDSLPKSPSGKILRRVLREGDTP